MPKQNKTKTKEIDGDAVAAETAEPEGPAAAGGDLLRELDAAQAERDAARAEREEMKGRYLRSVADLENFRRRMARDKQDIIRGAAAGVIEELLPVLDNLAIGLEAAEKHPEAREVSKGFAMVHEQLKQVLAAQGLEELRPDGEAFDPNFHECVSHQPSAEVDEGLVIITVRAGYRLHERLVRAASVIVSSGREDGEHDASGI